MLIHLRIRHLTFSRNVTRKYFTLRTCFRTIHFPKYRHISKILTFKRTNSWRQNFQGKNSSENFVFVNSRFEKFVLKNLKFLHEEGYEDANLHQRGPFWSALFWWCNDDGLLKWVVKPSLKEWLVASTRPSHRYSPVWSRVTTKFARNLSRGWFEPWCASLWSSGRLHHTTPLCHSPLHQDTVPYGVTHRRRQQSFLAVFQTARLSLSFDSRWGWRLLNPGGSLHGVNSPRLCRDSLTKFADNAPLANPGQQSSAHWRLQAARLSHSFESMWGRSC